MEKDQDMEGGWKTFNSHAGNAKNYIHIKERKITLLIIWCGPTFALEARRRLGSQSGTSTDNQIL